MSDQYNRYVVKYHTQPSVGSAFYRGTVEVWADNDTDAELKAKKQLKRDAFRDYGLNHIVVDEITRKN